MKSVKNYDGIWKNLSNHLGKPTPSKNLPKLAGPLNNTRLFGVTDPTNEGPASLGKSIVTPHIHTDFGDSFSNFNPLLHQHFDDLGLLVAVNDF